MTEHNQPTRRAFLTKSAAAGALIGFPAIVPAGRWAERGRWLPASGSAWESSALGRAARTT